MHQEVHDADQRRHGRGGDQAGENHVLFESERACLVFQPPAPGAIAHEQELDPGTKAHQRGGDCEQVVVPLEFEEPGDFADDDIVRREAQPGAELEVVGRGEERFEREAAEDLGVLVRAPDAGGQVLLLHGFGNDHEMRGDPGGITFRRTKQRVGERTLEGAEGRSVNRVENDRDTCAGRGQPPQNARFAAVGVDNLRLPGAKQFRELLPGPTSFQGWSGRTSSGTTVSRVRAAGESGSREPSGPRVGPAIKSTSSRLLPQAQDGRNGVLLGTPHDQARDDMCDPHPVRSRRAGLQPLKALADEFGFGSIGLSIGQVELVVPDRGISVLPLPGNFSQAVIDLESGRESLLQDFVILLRGSNLSARR